MEETVPYLSATELNRKLHSGQPVLVEFCVPRGCFRCNEMGVQIATLAEQLADQVDVVRVNLNLERAFALDLGITVCPTYIAFAEGEELFRAAYPTSGHLLLAKLDELTVQP